MTHKMKSSTLLAAIAIVCCNFGHAQWQGLLTGQVRLNPAPPPSTVTVGNNYTFTGSAFNIRGDWMAPTTGEVMRTLAPLTSNNYFRMYHGVGTNGGYQPQVEAAQFFSLANSVAPTLHFHLNAPNGALRLQTSSLNRVHVNRTLSTSINTFAAAPRDGFMLLSGQNDAYTNAISSAPFTRLHLVDDVGAVSPIIYAQSIGYRPWMRNGITFTGNADQGYIGHKYGENDVTDLVIQWSDNPAGSLYGVDRMKFVFSSNYTGAARGMGSIDGMEAIRLWPSSGTTVNVGIGDFAPAGTGDPTERVDILDGKLRIRQLPIDLVSTSLEAVVVNTTTGVLEHRPFPAGTGGTACDWEVLGGDVVTAYLPNGTAVPGCPEEDNSVIIGASPIGLPAVNAKLKVYAKPGGAGALYIHSPHFGSAVQVEAYPLSGPPVTQQTAISGFSKNASQFNRGVAAAATIEAGNSCSLYNAGVNAEAIVEGSAEENYGTRALATILPGGTSRNYAVFGAGKVEIGGICASNNGLYGIASGPAIQNIGAYGLAYDSPTFNYGVYGAAGGPPRFCQLGGIL